MAVGDLISQPFQLELNGLLMGPSTDFVTRQLDLWSAPDIRTGETARAQQHGLYAGTDWLGGRMIAAAFYVTGTTDAVEVVNRQSLAAAWQMPASGTRAQLVWQEDDGVKYCVFGKPRLASPKVEPRLPTECRFVATDPRIYANVASSAATGLATASGGLLFPAVAPFVFGTGGAGATMACTNAGTFSTPWSATFTGPLVAPTLTHVTSGKALILSGASLAAGETLVVDSAAHTVLLNGTASRFSWLAGSSQWFDLDPGSNAVNLTGASGAGTVTITWRSAWI